MSTPAWVAVYIDLVGMVWFAGVINGNHLRCREEDTITVGDGVVRIPLGESDFGLPDFDRAGFGPDHGHDRINGGASGVNNFLLSAAASTETINGFNLTNGDHDSWPPSDMRTAAEYGR